MTFHDCIIEWLSNKSAVHMHLLSAAKGSGGALRKLLHLCCVSFSNTKKLTTFHNTLWCLLITFNCNGFDDSWQTCDLNLSLPHLNLFLLVNTETHI